MMRYLTAIFAALALAAVASDAAMAHGDAELGEYRISVGFLNEPAYEGAMNAVEVRVTKPTAASADDSQDDGHAGHSHAGHSHSTSAGEDALESETPLGVAISAEVADGGGVSVGITTDGWRWAPESVDGAHKAGEGHAHIYVDGVKIGRVYGPGYDLVGLEPGERHIRVTLNANDHKQLTVNGEPVEASATVTIPGMAASDMAMDGMAHADMTGVEGLENSLRVEITHVASETSRILDLHAAGTAGHYRASLIPTSPGHYRIRLFGGISGEAIDQTFESRSGGGDFDDVSPASDIQFPIAVVSNRELESATRGAQEGAIEALNAAIDTHDLILNANRRAVTGMILGGVGLVAGMAAVAVAALYRRRG